MSRRKVGEFGLPYSEAGSVLQAMLDVIHERGWSRKRILAGLKDFNEPLAWDVLGPVIDELTSELGLHGDPEEQGYEDENEYCPAFQEPSSPCLLSHELCEANHIHYRRPKGGE